MVTQPDAALNTSPSSSSAVTIAYGRMRRWLGIGYVGMVTTSCLLVLGFGLAGKFFSTTSQPIANLASELSCAIVVFSLCSLPFDVVGFNIEKLYGRTSLTLQKFLLKQISAVFRYDLVLLAMALSLATVWANFGLFGLSVGSVLLSLLLISTQLSFVRFYGGVLSERAPSGQLESALDGASARVVLVHTDQRTFSGGIVGLPGFEKIVIPKWWISDFSAEQLRAVLARRSLIITSGGRLRGVLLALAFTEIGLLLAASVTTLHFALPLNSSAGVVTMSALFTIWSFWGLLVLPQFSHAGVYEADRLALDAGTNREVLLQAIVKIDGHLEDEQERSPAIDTIFHPVPTIAHRLSALASSDKCKQLGAWQAARYAVFLSVIGLGLLGRAVHCNAGKPELWAMLPAD